MRDYSKILIDIYNLLYMRDVDYSLNIFLCGARTSSRDSIRDLLNTELKKFAKFNVVYPEDIFASLYGKGGYNLLELEDELANLVDIIILPLEGFGAYCELGAFASNKGLLPKMIVLNNLKHRWVKSFINLGPVDLIRDQYPNNLIFYDESKKIDVLPIIVGKLRLKKHVTLSYELENIFNLSRYILYLIALFQPIDLNDIDKLLKTLDKGKIKQRFINSALQVLIQKNRIEQETDLLSLKVKYILSDDGHNYVFEELVTRLKMKRNFTNIRCEIINDRYKPQKRKMSKEKELLDIR